MKTNYTVTTPEELRSVCIRNKWFTEGTNRQYDKLFYANEMRWPIDEIATIIWLASDTDETTCRRDILYTLKELQEEYMGSLGVQQQAQGEREPQTKYTVDILTKQKEGEIT